MPQQFLDRPDVVPALEQVGRKRVAQGVATHGFRESGLHRCGAHGFLDSALVKVVTHESARRFVPEDTSGREHPLPRPLPRGVRVLGRQRAGQSDAPRPRREVRIVKRADTGEVGLERRPQRDGEHRVPVLVALPFADEDLVALEVDVLDAEPQPLQEAHAGAVQEPADQVRSPLHAGEQAPDLVPAQHDRQPRGPARAHEALEPGDAHAEHVLVEEQQPGERLVLGRGGHVAFGGEVREEGVDLDVAHVLRVTLAVEEDEAPDPAHVGLLGPVRVVPCPQRRADAVEQARGLRIGCGMEQTNNFHADRAVHTNPLSRGGVNGDSILGPSLAAVKMHGVFLEGRTRYATISHTTLACSRTLTENERPRPRASSAKRPTERAVAVNPSQQTIVPLPVAASSISPTSPSAA